MAAARVEPMDGDDDEEEYDPWFDYSDEQRALLRSPLLLLPPPAGWAGRAVVERANAPVQRGAKMVEQAGMAHLRLQVLREGGKARTGGGFYKALLVPQMRSLGDVRRTRNLGVTVISGPMLRRDPNRVESAGCQALAAIRKAARQRLEVHDKSVSSHVGNQPTSPLSKIGEHILVSAETEFYNDIERSNDFLLGH